MDLQEQYDKLLRYCLLKTKDRYMAEDIVQETFLRFWQSHSYQDTGKELAYLYTIARNLCMDEFRRARPENIDDLPELADADGLESDKKLTDMALEEVLNKLPDILKEIVMLRYTNELSVADIGKICNMSRFAVHRRLKEGMTILKNTDSEHIYGTDTTYEGMDAIRYRQELAVSQGEYLTEEYVTEVLARHGKGKMIRAKLLASLTFSFGYLGIGYLVSCLGLFAVLGTDGFDLPVQLLDNAIPYKMNMGQFLALQLLVSFVITFFVTVLILFFSAITKSSLDTMAIMLFVLAGPAFLNFSKTSRLWNHMLAVTMVRLNDLKECLGSFIDYRIGNFVVGLVPFSIAVYIISGLALAAVMRRTFVARSLRG